MDDTKFAKFGGFEFQYSFEMNWDFLAICKLSRHLAEARVFHIQDGWNLVQIHVETAKSS